jgi:hypothetical protein
LFYSRKLNVDHWAEKYFPMFAPIALIFSEGKFIGGAHNDRGTLRIFGLEGGLSIADQFSEEEKNDINAVLQRQLKVGEEVLDSTT